MPQYLNDRAVTSMRYLPNCFFKGEVIHCYILYLGRDLNHEHCLKYNFFLAMTLTLKRYPCIKKACLPNLWCPWMTAWSEAFHPWESFSSVFALCWRKSRTMLICPSLAAVITADLESKVSCHYKYIYLESWFSRQLLCKSSSSRNQGQNYSVELRRRNWLLVWVYQG